jgi:hypothetical protein
MELLATEPSPHKTGRSLRRVSVAFNVLADRSDEISRELASARGQGPPLSGADGLWRVLNSSYSYEQDDSTHRHRVELQEVEEPPVAGALEMLGLSVRTRKYEENPDVEDGILVVSALVYLEGEDDSRLEFAIRENRATTGYFPVVRTGVSDAPLDMRFGRCLWQAEGAGRLHLLRLVDDKEADHEPGPWSRMHQPELGLALRKIAGLEDQLEALVKTLRDSGALDAHHEAAIRESTEGSWGRHVRDFDQVTDIESYFD